MWLRNLAPLFASSVSGLLAVVVVAAVAVLPLQTAAASPGAAQIRACVPKLLGAQREHQVFAFDQGKITQPLNDAQCLTATDSFTVQPASGPRGMAWGIVMAPCSSANAANQTWELTANGNIVLSSLKLCIDIASYKTKSGSLAHLWPCTEVPPGGHACPTRTHCPTASCTCVSNQQFDWQSSGSVISLMSGLCFDVGSTAGPPKTCDAAPTNASTFCDRTLTPEARAAALVAEANLTERVVNLAVGTPGYPRLGVGAPTFGEALHGVCKGCGPASSPNSTGCATSFPHALAAAATFNTTLWTMIGDVVGLEGRAMQNENGGGGVTYFAPNVNLYRDPRWGRGMEVPGEDPLTSGEYGARFVKAMQARSADGRTLRVTAAPKHFLNYDMEGRKDSWQKDWGPSRNDFNAVVSKQEQVEYYLAQFHRMMTVGQPGGVMCSTNRVNGVDACMNDVYLNGFLRERFNFSGFVVTDGNSCGNTNCRATVKLLKNATAAAEWTEEGHELAAELCLAGGTDIELGSTLSGYTMAAVAHGLVPEGSPSRSNSRLYAQMIAQGHLDKVPLDQLGSHDVDTAHSRQVAFEAAVQAMVLLKNTNGTLPLSSSSNLKIAIVGPHLNSTIDLLSGPGYAGQNKIILDNTIESAMQRRAAASRGRISIVGTAGGCNIVTGCQNADLSSVASAVAKADVVLAFVGLHPETGAMNTPGLIRAHNECTEGEAWDRGDIKLCGQQQAILETALKPRKPLISVLINGGSIAATWIKEHSAAVLEAWYPGQAGGEAVAAVLFGDHNPGGRLPVTIYDETLVMGRNITDMSLRSAEGLTYMHYKGNPLWPFGFGLSYTRWSTALSSENEVPFAITTAEVSAAYAAYYSDSGLMATPLHTLTLHVTNEGQRTSDVVVQVFAVRLSPLTTVGALSSPVRQLAGFSRASALSPGESRAVRVGLAPLPFCIVDGSGNQWVEPATWRLAGTVDGVAMLNTTLVVSGVRQKVLEWPDRSP